MNLSQLALLYFSISSKTLSNSLLILIHKDDKQICVVLYIILLLHEHSQHVVCLSFGLICTGHNDIVPKLKGEALNHLPRIREVVTACYKCVLVKEVLRQRQWKVLWVLYKKVISWKYFMYRFVIYCRLC